MHMAVPPRIAALLQGYIHCAINPSTILLKRDNTVCLSNMFHALEVGSSGHRAGMLEYMPPEMISLATQEEMLGGALPRMHRYSFGPAVDVWQVCAHPILRKMQMRNVRAMSVMPLPPLNATLFAEGANHKHPVSHIRQTDTPRMCHA